jgi:hypothetical protein
LPDEGYDRQTNLTGKAGQMQGATTDDEPMGRNPGTNEAAKLTALKVRGCDLALRFADLIEASGHVPCFKAVHMNAPSPRVKSIEKPLAPRAVPHMSKGPAMHLTSTLDVIVLINGSVRLVLDDDETVLRAGDVVIQRGTNHAWICDGPEPALLVAVLIDKTFST